ASSTTTSELTAPWVRDLIFPLSTFLALIFMVHLLRRLAPFRWPCSAAWPGYPGREPCAIVLLDCPGCLEVELPAHPQAVRHPVDVVEPGGDQIDLQDGPVIEAHPAQPAEVCRSDAGGISGELGHV